jgi:hypothetical protein
VLKAADPKARRDWLAEHNCDARQVGTQAVRMSFTTEGPFFPFHEPEDQLHGRPARQLSLARAGPLDRRAQAVVPSALRSDTPKAVTERDGSRCSQLPVPGVGAAARRLACHPGTRTRLSSRPGCRGGEAAVGPSPQTAPVHIASRALRLTS